MTKRKRRDELVAPWVAMALILCAWGIAAGVMSVSRDDPVPRAPVAEAQEATGAPVQAAQVTGTSGEVDGGADVAALRQRGLAVPVWGVEPSALVPSFADPRDGTRTHEAVDIAAPAGTSVIAADAGTIAKLFESAQGGLTIYQFDSTGTYCYYYAHLEEYVPGLAEGDTVERGQTIGYVGSSGNASPDAPHLHFAIFRLGPEQRWWEGEPIDPYLVLR